MASASAYALPREKYKRLTWKNGLGFTDEVAIHPEGSDLKRGDFIWRVSSARIEQSSPFSLFPEHDRVLVILTGNGVKLTHTFAGEGSEESTELPAFFPYEFPGDVPSRCELISGPVTDLSVFFRKGTVEALVDVVEVTPEEPFRWFPSGSWNLLFAAEGAFKAYSPMFAAPIALEAGSALRVDLREPISEDQGIDIRAIRGGGKLVVISLQG
jgi:environmental stress-induced protein Ves